MFEGNFLMSRTVSKHVVSGVCTGVLMAMSVQASAGVDAKLLDMLRANGSITHDQRMELQAELEKEEAQKEKNKTASAKFEEKLAWAAKTQLKGDVRVRQESITSDGNGNDQNRQRIRMRLGAYSQVNDEVDVGIRIATGSGDTNTAGFDRSDRRSTNQNMDNYFDKKSIWLDQAYIDWHPNDVKNLHLIGGKMPQAWVAVNELIWDADINPEGLAATYKYGLGGKTELFGSLGYYNLKDNTDGNGVQWKHDTQMYAGQLGIKFVPADKVGVTLGGSVYSFDNDKLTDATGTAAPKASALTSFGNTTSQFQLWEGFGQIDINRWAMPLSLYGQYVYNADAKDEIAFNGHGGNGGDKGDTGYLLGFKTGYGKFKFDYNYRDVQRNAVVGMFTDSDFADGRTGSRGHKFSLGYDISKNFTAGATYFKNDSDNLLSGASNTNTSFDRWQLDVMAKF